jgi:hypothetical protein
MWVMSSANPSVPFVRKLLPFADVKLSARHYSRRLLVLHDNLLERRQTLLVDHVGALRSAFEEARKKHPFEISAIVVLQTGGRVNDEGRCEDRQVECLHCAAPRKELTETLCV